MKRTILFLYSIISGLFIYAQNNPMTLHPVVGDTIDKVELKKYFLFNEYTNDSIDYIVLKEDKGLYFLLGIRNDTLILQREVSEDLLLSQKENIEKLNKYFTSTNNKDSVYVNINIDSISNKQVDLNFKTPEFNKSIKKEKRHNYWQEKRDETKVNQKNGMIY